MASKYYRGRRQQSPCCTVPDHFHSELSRFQFLTDIPKSLALWQGGKRVNSDELTQVSDSDSRMQPRLQGRRVLQFCQHRPGD
ncbi:hypothetical protein EAH77_18155 [Ewingella americana]|uniref:Uncharacterized protein n=1 Tax=Ewingella americana TaxID=41202 RepID=A0A502GDQ0_9GAMM|nr:hypothetical protein EAH77_18155 [Ewingella americana]